ncbi:hypothetical protein L2E82_31325 [Cichorium intybus]|uniref:Uncharacterized protein n=1 Tax=Cichorium intybus TaxID=13427 RepID=A0ACB9D2V8_CICIN|nr:hypothetical protein L2E82_31325 [Cichorium intybus]
MFLPPLHIPIFVGKSLTSMEEATLTLLQFCKEINVYVMCREFRQWCISIVGRDHESCRDGGKTEVSTKDPPALLSVLIIEKVISRIGTSFGIPFCSYFILFIFWINADRFRGTELDALWTTIEAISGRIQRFLSSPQN